MSRRVRQSSTRRPQNTNPYQPNGYQQHYHASRNGRHLPTTTIDIGFSDNTTDTQSYYDYYQDNGFQHSPLRESRNTDCTFSDDSGSTRLPYFEFDDETNKRYSRNAFSDRSMRKDRQPGKDLRKVYPNQDAVWDRLYQEIPSPVARLQPVSRASERPQSSLSSGLNSAALHGCGGKCQTFENVCYFFLQLVFAMGILIGVSLCIAGVVLRESAARKLQVLVYIGVLLAMVSALLLSIQCNARNSAKRRKQAIQNAKRAPIPLDTIHPRPIPIHQEPLMLENHRAVQMPQVHRPSTSMMDEQGIPWWRRKDLNPAIV